jgi:type IV pilus assembly protein PilM
MTLLDRITALVKEPPPAYAFELSEKGIASSHAAAQSFRELPEGTISVSPVHDNVQKPADLSAAVAGLYPAANGNKKRRTAALIVPDYSCRLQILDFDSFPEKPEEQLQLVRFRVKKTIPFDIDAAGIGYHAQRAASGKLDVVVAVIALEILARYEAPFRAAGYHTGYITTSALAALNLAPDSGVTVFAKLSGHVLTVVVLDGTYLKLIRCLEIESVSPEAVLSILYPTVAYVEDELQTSPNQLAVCGFGEYLHEWGVDWHQELGLPVQPVSSRLGPAGTFNAGLLGFLQDGGVVQ